MRPLRSHAGRGKNKRARRCYQHRRARHLFRSVAKAVQSPNLSAEAMSTSTSGGP
jgi:hypothetical protein